MTEDKSATSTKEINKEQGTDKKESVTNPKTDTGKAAEKPVWEKAAETIAGDNKLLESLLKLVLSPVALIGGLGLLVYCFFELKKYKEQNEKLQEESKEMEKNYQELKEKYKKWKALAKELESKQPPENNIGFVQQKILPMQNTTPGKKTYHSDYLD